MLRKFITLIILLLATVASAREYTFKEGMNTVKGFDSAQATFTPDRDGKVLIEAQEVWNVTSGGEDVAYSYVPGNGLAYTYEVSGAKAGQAISLVSDFVWNEGSKVKITMYGDGPVPVQVLNITPKMGTTFDWNNTGMVTLNMNKVVTLSSIKLVAGDYMADVDDVHVGSSFSFNISHALNTAMKEGKLEKGDKFQIVIKGLCEAADRTNLYNGTGEMVLEYLAPYPQHNFVSATVDGNQLSYMQSNDYKFLSYYPADGTDGLFVFEFDGEIGKVGGVTLSMGNLDLDAQGKFHRSNLPYTIEGNRLLVDARGKLRTLAVLFPAVIDEEPEDGVTNEGLGSYDTQHITISLMNILDVNGNAFLCQLQGSVGSYSIVMNYEEIIDEAYIDGDNKQDGDPVCAGEEVSLWLSNAGIRFDGIEVSYFVDVTADESESAVYEQRQAVVTEFTAVPDALEGVIITFAMPEMNGVVAGSTIRVALHNANTADGMPHYLFIEFVAADKADAIRTVTSSSSGSGKVYRLDGIEAQAGQSGIYLKEGRKFFRR